MAAKNLDLSTPAISVYGNSNLRKDSPREEELTLDTNFASVATAGQPVKITKLYAGQTMTIWAADGNTGYVYIGNRHVDNTTGYPLALNGTLSINLTTGYEKHKYLELYLDADTAGNKIHWIKI